MIAFPASSGNRASEQAKGRHLNVQANEVDIHHGYRGAASFRHRNGDCRFIRSSEKENNPRVEIGFEIDCETVGARHSADRGASSVDLLKHVPIDWNHA